MCAPPSVPPAGIWAPAITLFEMHTDLIDQSSQQKYFTYLSQTGLAGLVVLGTNAETFLLTRPERALLVALARSAVGRNYPLMAGVGGHSTLQVLEHIEDAAQAGANYVLVLPPGYFAKNSTSDVVEGFFDEIAEKSRLPVVLYNFPGVCNGVDLDSALVARLARRWPGKVVGVKLTCGSVAKMTRLAAELPADSFRVYGGQSDFLIGGLAVGSAGCIAAFGNVAPRTIVRVYELWRWGMREEALEVHRRAALGEQAIKSGIAAVKYAASLGTGVAAGIEGGDGEAAEVKFRPRKPYLPLGEGEKVKVREALGDLLLGEKML